MEEARAFLAHLLILEQQGLELMATIVDANHGCLSYVDFFHLLPLKLRQQCSVRAGVAALEALDRHSPAGLARLVLSARWGQTRAFNATVRAAVESLA